MAPPSRRGLPGDVITKIDGEPATSNIQRQGLTLTKKSGGTVSIEHTRAGGSRAGPPRNDLVAVAAIGVAGTLRRPPAGTRVEQIPDGIKIAGLQGGPDPPGEHGRLFRGAGIIWHDDLPCSAQLATPA